MHTLTALCLVFLCGCALGPGEGFATLEPTARVGYTLLPARDAGGGFQKLDTDYQAALGAARLTVTDIALQGAATAAGGGGSFDPGNPPPGYSLCHGGHCHRDDGALISYEDIAAELAGGGAGPRTVVSLPLGSVDLLAPTQRELGCAPDCELPRTQVQRARWSLGELTLEGRVRDARPAPRFAGERRFRVALAAGSGPFTALDSELPLSAGRAEAPRVALALHLDVTAQVLDGVDWGAGALDDEGTIDLGLPQNAALRERVLENVAALAPRADVTRSER